MCFIVQKHVTSGLKLKDVVFNYIETNLKFFKQNIFYHNNQKAVKKKVPFVMTVEGSVEKPVSTIQQTNMRQRFHLTLDSVLKRLFKKNLDNRSE